VDWFERLTGISPDGGHGWFELLVIAVVASGLCLRITSRRVNWRRRQAVDDE